MPSGRTTRRGTDGRLPGSTTIGISPICEPSVWDRSRSSAPLWGPPPPDPDRVTTTEAGLHPRTDDRSRSKPPIPGTSSSVRSRRWSRSRTTMRRSTFSSTSSLRISPSRSRRVWRNGNTRSEHPCRRRSDTTRSKPTATPRPGRSRGSTRSIGATGGFAIGRPLKTTRSRTRSSTR